jgi:hypothetical protein
MHPFGKMSNPEPCLDCLAMCHVAPASQPAMQEAASHPRPAGVHS